MVKRSEPEPNLRGMKVHGEKDDAAAHNEPRAPRAGSPGTEPTEDAPSSRILATVYRYVLTCSSGRLVGEAGTLSTSEAEELHRKL